MIKYLLITILLLTNTSHAQLSVEAINSKEIVRLLNNIQIIDEFKNDVFNVRVYGLTDSSGSASFENCESLTYLYFAISEFDELPKQNLFKLSPLYNPILNEISGKNDSILISLKYGIDNEQKKLNLYLSIDNMAILK